MANKYLSIEQFKTEFGRQLFIAYLRRKHAQHVALTINKKVNRQINKLLKQREQIK